jgi:hypothetical protein
MVNKKTATIMVAVFVYGSLKTVESMYLPVLLVLVLVVARSADRPGHHFPYHCHHGIGTDAGIGTG